jgi:hypothetical protein
MGTGGNLLRSSSSSISFKAVVSSDEFSKFIAKFLSFKF